MGDARMPFLSHLEELRRRLIVAVIAVGIGFLLTFNYSEVLLHLLKWPLGNEIALRRTSPYFTIVGRQAPDLVFLAPAEAFWMHMKISFVAGLLVALPLVLYHIWRFVEPGLLPHERRFAFPFVILSTISFAVGMLFCFILVLPFAMNFLLTYKTQELKPMLSVGMYVDFMVKFLLAFGLIFELPLAIALAARLGFVTPTFLARNRKYAILVNFVIAAILTPTPDIFNQSLMAVPMCLLYEVGIWAARIIARRPPPMKPAAEMP